VRFQHFSNDWCINLCSFHRYCCATCKLARWCCGKKHSNRFLGVFVVMKSRSRSLWFIHVLFSADLFETFFRQQSSVCQTSREYNNKKHLQAFFIYNQRSKGKTQASSKQIPFKFNHRRFFRRVGQKSRWMNKATREKGRQRLSRKYFHGSRNILSKIGF
jgi:hypothetical protein